MRPSPINAFEHTTIPYGDDGRPVRGIIARCKYCSAAIPLPVNTIPTRNGADDDIEWQFIARKLEAKGWRIGKTRTSHLCPACFGKVRSAASRKSKEEPVANNVQVVNENTRVLTRADRRIIIDKLTEVYPNDRYDNGWTDEKVAVDLGVPRAWVRLIREENFGDEGSNDEIRKLMTDAAAVLVEIKAQQPQLTRLLAIADKIEKSLVEFQKVLK